MSNDSPAVVSGVQLTWRSMETGTPGGELEESAGDSPETAFGTVIDPLNSSTVAPAALTERVSPEVQASWPEEATE